MSSATLGVVLIAAALIAIVPFAVMLVSLRETESLQTLDFIVAGVAVFVIAFPMVVALVTPRRNDARGTL